MSPVAVMGRELGVQVNGVFNDSNTDPIPGGRLWNGSGTNDVGAARSWNDMRQEALKDGVDLRPLGPNSSARSIAAQKYFWGHQPPPAAYPGTSNHGWGIAVDVSTPAAAAWLMTHGHRFGWSHDEGARVGEWWHFRYIGGYKPPKDPLRFLMPDERAMVVEYDRLRRAGRNLPRRRELRAMMTKRRKEIWRAAQSSSGWGARHRRERYNILRSRTT